MVPFLGGGQGRGVEEKGRRERRKGKGRERREGRGCFFADLRLQGNLQFQIFSLSSVSAQTSPLCVSLLLTPFLQHPLLELNILIGPQLCLPYKQTHAWSSAHLPSDHGRSTTDSLRLLSFVCPQFCVSLSWGVCLQGPERPGDVQSVSLLVVMVTDSRSWGCPHPLPSAVRM